MAAEIFDELDAANTWDLVIADEPGLAADVGRPVRRALETIGDFVDLKSPFTIGHSPGFADLAAAAPRLGLPADETTRSAGRPGARLAASACRTRSG